MRGTREKRDWLTRGATFRRKAEGIPSVNSGLARLGWLRKWFCVFLLAFAWCGPVSAAPFDRDMTFTQPDGTKITFRGKGDEFYATFTYNGYSIVYDQPTRAYYYAKCSADGTTLELTDAKAGIDPVPVGVEPNEAGKVSPDVIHAQIDARRAEWEEKMGIRKGWEKIKADFHETQRKLESGQPVLMAAKYPETTGVKVGLTILVDFPDSPRSSSITSERIDQLLNGENCTLFGNVSSVRSYYLDVSNGNLDYSNLVIPYIRVARAKSVYNSMSGAWQAFFTDIFTALRERMEEDETFRAELLEKFEQLTLTDGNVVRCFNVWYAGEPDVGWSQGLWPASGPIGITLQLPYSDLVVNHAQMSNLSDAPSIYVFCHENGHMLCDYPDFYDYQYDSIGGAGAFCLMSSRLSGSDQNPPIISAPLRYLSGWTTPVKLSKFQSKSFEVKSSAEGWDAQNTIYLYENKNSIDSDGHAKEYYLIENRQKSGRDATIPASGIAIWHMDELGDTDDQRYAYNTDHHNYEATLIQADGKWDFENNRNSGDANDLYYEGNTASGYVNAFTSMTDYDSSATHRGCSSRWWSGQPTGLNIVSFSTRGSVMTFETRGVDPAISNRGMKNGRVGSLYKNVFTAVNAEGEQTWTIEGGTLPEGLEMDNDLHAITGIPMEEGDFEVTVHVETTEGQKVSATYTFTILPMYDLPYEESFTNDAPDSTWGWFEEDDPLIATDDGTDEDPELDDGEPDDGEPDDDEGFDLGGDPDGDGDGDGDGEPDDGDPDAGDEPDEPEEEPEEDSIYYSGLSWTVRNGNANNGGYPDGAKSAPFCLSFATNRLPQKVLSLSSNVIETVTDEEGNATVKTNKVKYSETRTLYPRKLISTPMLDFTDHRRIVLSFNLINRKRSGRQDELRVYYRTAPDDEWILLESYTNSVNLWTAQEIVLPPEAESDTAYIGFEGILYGGYGIHIDDVVISDPVTELTLGDVALEEAIIGVPYEVQIPVTGGVQPYTWELDGDLPDGLSFTNGVIYGTPTTEETCTFTVTVSDEDEVETDSQTYTLVVDLPHVTVWQETFDHASGEMPTDWTQECVEENLRWVAYSGSPSHVPNASVEGVYNASLYWHDYVTGERTNHITRLITPLVDFGENPSKLALNFWLCMRDRYNLSTTPRDQDELRVYFKESADDEWGEPIAVYTNSVDWWTFQKIPLTTDYTSGYFCFEGNAKAGHGICIDDVRIVDATDCPIVITKSPLPSAYATAPYSVTLQATGGVGEYTWEVYDEEDLPPGLTLSEDGVLSGTPTRTGTYYFDVLVTDEEGNSSDRTLSVTFMGGIKPSQFVGTFDEGMDWDSWSVVNEKARGWIFTNGSAPRELHAPIPNAAYEGNTNALLFFNGSTRYVSRLTTPMIDFSGATNVTLSFWLCKATYSGYSDELYVDYRTNYEGEATTLLAITTNVAGWTQYTVELPEPTATTFITFRGKTKGGYGIALDDVTFDVLREESELTVYQQWKLDWLGDADYDDDDDYDEDGLSTQEEFVFGADPTMEDYEAALLNIWIEDGIAYVSFRAGVEALNYGVTFELQSCSDLTLGDWTSEGLVLVDTDDTETDYVEMIYTYGDGSIATTPQRFFRLKATWPDDDP